MAVFISYSSRDRAAIDGVLAALRRAHEQVWFDEELGGGESWWRTILEQVRGCEVFIVALSKNMLESKACQAELRYAQELGKPVLPVLVGPMDNLRINPLAQMQTIDYRNPSIEAGIELVSSVHARRAQGVPLPDPLPEEPPIPFAYLMRLASTISDPSPLSAQQQMTLVAELKAGLEEDGNDASACRDIRQLLCMLRDRSDVTWRTRTEVESVLAALETSQTPPPSPVLPLAAPTAAPKANKSATKWILAGGGVAAAVIAVVAVVAVLAVTGNGPTVTPEEPVPTVDRAAFDGILLAAAEIHDIVGTSTLTATDVIDRMDDFDSTMSDPTCVGLMGTALNSVYAGSGYSAVRDQGFSAENPGVWVGQTAVLFPAADRAQTLFDGSADKWGRCSGATVTLSSDDGDQRWSFGELAESDSHIAMTSTLEAGGGTACGHAMRVSSNLIIESFACHDHVTDAAERIVERIAAKVSP
ncbi:sensor domain-containing protein [Mycolicibacterium sp. XJ1819]